MNRVSAQKNLSIEVGGSWAVPPNTLTGAAHAPIRLALLVGRKVYGLAPTPADSWIGYA